MDRGLISSRISERQLHSLQGNPGFILVKIDDI